MVVPSTTALLALLLIVPLSAMLFSSLSPTRAALMIVIGVTLFGPERIEIPTPPGLPNLDKNSLATLCAFIGLCITSPSRVRAAKLFRGGDFFLVVLLVANLVTEALNHDTLVYGPLAVSGFVTHHWIRSTIGNALSFVVPFWIGRIAVRDRQDGLDLVSTFVTLAAIYVPLVAVELRLSPQMHNWVYGYAQHQFSQTVRGDGYRPMVFMAHGLALAMFLFAAVAMAWMAKQSQQKLFGYPALFFVAGLAVVLVAVKSLGALLFLIIFLTLALLTSPRTQLRVATIIAVLTIAYPILRFTDNFPTTKVLDLAGSYEKDRADSLQFRFVNEDILLAKAMERPFFGWGGEGRARVYDDQGRDICVTDGAWVIFVGAGGAFGLLSRFLIMLHPLWRALWRLNRIDPSMRTFVSTLGIIVVFNVVDQIPNGIFNVLPVLLSGALSGLLDGRLGNDNSKRLAQLAAYVWLRRWRATAPNPNLPRREA